jgi:hypothetical protein
MHQNLRYIQVESVSHSNETLGQSDENASLLISSFTRPASKLENTWKAEAKDGIRVHQEVELNWGIDKETLIDVVSSIGCSETGKKMNCS